MEEKKRPWHALVTAAAWTIIFLLQMDSYMNFSSIADKVFSPEEWQQLQLDKLFRLGTCGFIAILSFIRFFFFS